MNIRKFLIIGKLSLIGLICCLLYKSLVSPERPEEILSPASAIGSEEPSGFDMSSELANPTSDYSVLTHNNIFTGSTGSPRTNSNNTGTDFTEINGINSDLSLLGTICVNQELSRAVIKNLEDRKIGPYKIGDTVCGARILSIEDDKVILLYEGREKNLPLRSDKSISNPAISMQNETSKNETLEQPEKKAPIETTAGKIVILLKQADIEEYSVDEQTKGLKINGLKNIPFAERIGLKNGDVVTAVNGQQLTSKLKAYQVFKKARSQPKLTVELLRNNTTKMLVFDLR